MTLALRNQARQMERLHEKAGVTATKEQVELLDAHVVATTGAKAVYLDPALVPQRTPDTRGRDDRGGRGSYASGRTRR